MSLETTIASLVTAANNLTGAVTNKVAGIDAALAAAKAQFDQWRSNFSTTINGLEVYKQGGIRRYFFSQLLDPGGYTPKADGPDQAFPYCSGPKAPYYINLIEFDAIENGGTYGQFGDIFKADFILSHRGISNGSYLDQFSFSGTSFADSVSAILKVSNIANDGAISIFISEPNNMSKEIKLTKAMNGTSIPIDFRAYGQSVTGKARVTLKIDSRYHCGDGRAFSVDMSYTSNAGRPSVNRVSQVAPSWNA